MESPELCTEAEENQLKLRDLVRKLRSPGGVVPFIGAGMSASLGFPGWTALLTDNAKEDSVKSKVKQHLADGQYEEAAQVLEDDMSEEGFHELIRESFGAHKLKAPLDAPVTLLPKITSGPVVTTNFDRVLEEAFKQGKRPFDRVVRGVEVDTIGEALDLNHHILLKVHGDAEDRTHRILTLREYERNYNPDKQEARYLISTQLELLAIKRTLLFLGCSLEQDRLMVVLKAIKEKYQSTTHYALLQKPTDEATLAKRVKFLSERGVRPIWYPEEQWENIPAFLNFLIEQLSHRPASRIGEELADREEAILNRASSLLVGREPALQVLDQHTNSRDESIKVVTGNAGMGKTALMATWITQKRESDGRVAYHLFSERNGLTSVRDCYLHLITQLFDSDSLNEELIGASEDKLRQELYNRLKHLAAEEGDELILVLDGLDEAEHPFWPPFPTPVPGNLRVIVSARSGENRYLEGWTNGIPPLTLEPLSVEDVGSWLSQLDEALAKYVDDKEFLQNLWQQTTGFPLYLNYLFEELVSSVKAGHDPAAILTQRPAGFSAYVRDQLNLLTRDGKDFRGDVRKLFGLLSVTLGAITEDDLTPLTGLTALDVPSLPSKITRWFDFRSLPDGTITCSFSHPELAREFARALGKYAGDVEEELIRHCKDWKENKSRYALEYLPDHLSRAKRYPELFDLARDDSFFTQDRSFTGDVEASLKAVRTALAASAQLNDAARMAEFALLHAKRIAALKTETPLDALRNGPLLRVWQVADLQEPGRAILWHMLLAAELQEQGDRESALRTLLRLTKRNLEPLSGWYGLAAAGLFLPLASLSPDAIFDLSEKLLPGYGQTIEVVSAIHRVAGRLVERGLHDVALKVGGPREDQIRKQIIVRKAEHGDFDAAEKDIQRIGNKKLRSHVKAKLAFCISRAGDSERAIELLRSAVKDVQDNEAGHVEVAIEQARLGFVTDALDLLKEVEGKELYLARGLRDIAVSIHEMGLDSSPVVARFETMARDEVEMKLRSRVLSELAVAYLMTGRESDASRIRDELLNAEEENVIPALNTLAAGYVAVGNHAEAEKLFQEALKRSRHQSSRKDELFSIISKAQADAGLFTSAIKTIEEVSPGGWHTAALRYIVVKQASAGDLNGALKLFDTATGEHKETLAEIGSDLVAGGDWARARQLYVDLLQAVDKSAPWSSPKRDRCLARVSVVLAQQKLERESCAARAAIVDEETKAQALRDLAAAHAAMGEFASAFDLAKTISDEQEYVKGKAFCYIALEQARQGEPITALSAIDFGYGRREHCREATELLVFLREQKAFKLIEEFKLFQGRFKLDWWDDEILVSAIRSVALARSGDFKRALQNAKYLDEGKLTAAFEQISPIAIQQGCLQEVIAVAEELRDPQNAALALIGVGMAQIRMGSIVEGEDTLKLAANKFPKMENTPDRQKVLIALGVAHFLANLKSVAAEAWRMAIGLKQWHYTRNIDSYLAPLDPEDVCGYIVEGLVAADLQVEALEWVQTIDDLHERGRVLERIAERFTPGGDFSREVVRVAQGLVLKREDWMTYMIDVLVRIRDVDSVKILLAPAAETLDTAYEVCGALAELYPEQAAGIAVVVQA